MAIGRRKTATRLGARIGLSGCAFVAVGCAPLSRPIETPYRASIGVFYMAPPRSDASSGPRANVSLERWIDDRFILGVDAEHASFTRATGRTESLVGTSIRLAYVLDLAEFQPRFGARLGSQRWSHGDGGVSYTPAIVVPFAALDWAPRSIPLVLSVEGESAPIVKTGQSPAVSQATWGLRAGFRF